MRRRILLAVAAAVVMVVVAGVASQQPRGLLVLEWAHKAPTETPAVAVLIEFGTNDTKLAKTRDWSGTASVTGAKVVHREGYRFRPGAGDRLLDGGAWEAQSHRGLRVPPKQPAVAKMEAIATVGVVLHLADVKDDAVLTIEPKDANLAKTSVPLKAVLAGKAQELWDGGAVVRLVSTATLINDAKTEDDFPAAAYGPDGTLWVAYTSYTVLDDTRRIEQKPLAKQPENFKALYTPDFGDQLWVKSYRGGKWSEPVAVTGAKESIARCAIAVEGNGDVWVFYSAFRDGRHGLFGRQVAPKIDKEVALSTGGPAVTPVACTQADGSLLIAYQAGGTGAQGSEPGPRLSMVFIRGSNGKFQSSGLSAGQGSWTSSVAAGPGNAWAISYDTHEAGDYDVSLYLHTRDNKESANHVTDSARAEMRPSCAFDAKGRLWIAYEEGPERWGQDYGALNDKDGNPLYNHRLIKVVCRDADGKWWQPAAELPVVKGQAPTLPFDAQKTQNYERSTKFAYPQIGLDGQARIWLTYRQNFGSRYSSHPGSYWVTFARRLDGDRWSEPIEIHHSDGLLDSRPVLLPHVSGGLQIIHNTDGRYTTPEVIQNKIYRSLVNLTGGGAEPKLVPFQANKRTDAQVARAKKERAAVKTIRDYRVAAGGKKYQLLRGEFHRHTEISWDGGADGSLEDMFRYAIDAASLDWIGNGDHDNGAGREYAWWLVQKFTDAYHIPDGFTPMFTYERSVAYPHGHRNCMFAKRGVRTLPRLAAPGKEEAVGGVHADDTKMLYRYLHEMDGICASHTSATSMGTDWRDHDDAVEPIVEIYQGDRMSYEYEGAPRAGYDPKSGKLPANVAGWYPKGFINEALKKGYKLGFQSSSDHWSTHISFFVILSEKRDRQSLLEAVKNRHCYGATDNIVVDFRSGAHVMGDAFKAQGAPKFEIDVIGTSKIARIDVLRDSEVLHTIKPDATIYHGGWTDPQPVAGSHYYYIRVLQVDDEIAWASPMWVETAGK
jgi:hypothetical protein